MPQEQEEAPGLYAQGCADAFQNSKNLLDEAIILYNAGSFQRAYALGVLSAEEFAKAFVYKGFADGWVKPDKVALYRHALTTHKAKVGMFKILASLTYSLFSNPENWPIIESGNLPDGKRQDRKKAERIWKMFEQAEDLKLDAIYVDIRDGKVKSPKKAITWQMAKEILDFMTEITMQYDVPSQEFRTILPTRNEVKA